MGGAIKENLYDTVRSKRVAPFLYTEIANFGVRDIT